MIRDTGAEEIMHVEMLSSMIAQLLNGASPDQQADAAAANPAVLAALGGMNPQHLIVSGLGAMYADSNGNPWSSAYITASGNVAPDLYDNAVGAHAGRDRGDVDIPPHVPLTTTVRS